MKYARPLAALTAAVIIAFGHMPLATAQEMNHNMSNMEVMSENTPASMSTPSSSTAAPKVSGEIRKVDTDAGKITIRHGEIPNLEMPAMTMVFRFASPDMLGKVSLGDQVLFTAEKINGALTVTSIELQTAK